MSESRGIYDTELGKYVDENDNPIGEPTVAEETIAQVSDHDAKITNILRDVLEGHWLGAGGAAGKLVELAGGPDKLPGFTPVPGPADPH